MVVMAQLCKRSHARGQRLPMPYSVQCAHVQLFLEYCGVLCHSSGCSSKDYGCNRPATTAQHPLKPFINSNPSFWQLYITAITKTPIFLPPITIRRLLPHSRELRQQLEVRRNVHLRQKVERNAQRQPATATGGGEDASGLTIIGGKEGPVDL